MHERTALIGPVRRRLMLAVLAYLAGICTASVCALPWKFISMLYVLALLSLLMLRRYRRSILFAVAALMLLFGYTFALAQLGVQDEPSDPRVRLSGTVSAIEYDSRVYLTDVHIEGGQPPRRDVLVTLMPDENGECRSVSVGQRVSGEGRLFAQDQDRNPGGIDRRIQTICEGYELSGYVLSGWKTEGEARFSLREWFRQLRLALTARIQAQFGEHAPLFEAIMIGEKDNVDGETLAAMRLTGTVHVLTVSGMHLGLIAAALRALLRRLPMSKRLRFAIQTIVLVFFTCLTGGAPGTIRACIMALMRELAPLLGRRYEPLTALSAAALAITLVCPAMALNASFQFSFFVVLGILLLAELFARPARRRFSQHPRLRWLASSVCVSLAAQIAALPMQLLFYGYIPLLALPMNVMSSLCMPVLMLGGWLALAVGCAFPGLGECVSRVLGFVMGGFENLSLLAAGVEGGIVRLPAPHAVTVLLAAALMALLSERIRITFGRYRFALLTALLLAVSYAPRFDSRPMYVQLDVGQGDGALLRQGRRAVLVDVGPAYSYDMLRYLRYEGLKVEKVVLSHLDEDHAGALLTLLNSEIKIGGIAMAEGATEGVKSAAVLEALALAQQMGVPVEVYEKGDEIVSTIACFSVLSPDETLKGENERSMVLACEFDGKRLLTTGDLPSDSEMECPPDCDVLKVSHHGSKYATSAEFIAYTTPKIAFISVGENTYGHPTQRVLEDLAAAGARVYRTDISGCLTLFPHVERVEAYLKTH